MGEGWETARRRDAGQRLGGGRRWPARAWSPSPSWTPATSSATPPARASLTGIGPDGEVAAAAAHPAAARHPAPLRARRAPRRRPGAAGRLPGRRHGPAAAVGRPDRGRPGGAGPPLVRGAARRPGAGGARLRPACPPPRPAGWSAPGRWPATCRPTSPGCWTARRPDRAREPVGSPGVAARVAPPSASRRGAPVSRRLRLLVAVPLLARRAGRLRRRRSPADEWRPGGDALEEQVGSGPTSPARTTSRPRSARRPGARSPRGDDPTSTASRSP